MREDERRCKDDNETEINHGCHSRIMVGASPILTKPAPTILFVDDDRAILESIRDLFEAMMPKARILSAESGFQALPLVKEERPVVIASDYRMPDMDGLEFLRRSISLHPGAKRLMISAYTDWQAQLPAFQAAKVAFVIQKPFESEAFVQTVGQLLAPSAD